MNMQLIQFQSAEKERIEACERGMDIQVGGEVRAGTFLFCFSRGTCFLALVRNRSPMNQCFNRILRRPVLIICIVIHVHRFLYGNNLQEIDTTSVRLTRIVCKPGSVKTPLFICTVEPDASAAVSQSAQIYCENLGSGRTYI